MAYKKKSMLFVIIGLFLISLYTAQARYSISIPIMVDTGGNPVSSAKVGINISESSTNCVAPFVHSVNTFGFGRGVINVSSSRFIASRNYTICFNATVGANVIKGKTVFQPGVGNINVSTWVNGSKARFNSYFLNNGSNFDAIYGRDTTGGLSNNTAINHTKAWANTYFFGNGSDIRSIFVSQDTNNQTFPNQAVGNNTLASFFFRRVNLTNRMNAFYAIFSRNVSTNKYILTNGSDFDTIYGRDTTGGLSNNTAINGTKIWGNDILFGNGTSIKSVFVSQDTNNQTLARLALTNGTSARFRKLNATERLNVLFANITQNITARRYFLSNGSNFDVVYGNQGPSGGENSSNVVITNVIYNGTGIKLVQTFNGSLLKSINAYNGTLLKLINAYNGTLAKKFNNTNRGKTYFNNTVFFNGTVEGRTFRLRNGTLFDVIYGRDTTGGLNNGSNFNSTKIWSNNFFFGNLTNIKDVFVSEDTNNKTAPVGLISAWKNNTVGRKAFLNYTNVNLFGNLTLKGNLFIQSNATRKLANYTSRLNETYSQYSYVFRKTCYNKACSAYTEYNGTHVNSVIS